MSNVKHHGLITLLNFQHTKITYNTTKKNAFQNLVLELVHEKSLVIKLHSILITFFNDSVSFF